MLIDGKQLRAASVADAKLVVSYLKADGTRALTGNLSAGSNRITNLAAPSGANDAARLADVTSGSSGLDVKDSVRAATTANITLSGAQTIDGVSVIAGDRVLVKNQSTQSQNGLYLAASGAWSRTTDADVDVEVTSGLYVFVEEGTTNGTTAWVLSTANPIVVDTTSLVFVQFSSLGQVTAGAGLTKTGNTLDVGAGDGITVNADSITVALDGGTLAKSGSGLKVADGGVAATQLASDAVTTIKILDSNVTAAKLASNSVTTAKIADSTGASDGVTTAKLADTAVTAAKLASDAVTTVKILDANVTAGKLASDSVTTVKITDLNVTTAKINDLAVTAGKIASDAVTTAKILDANVTAGKLASDSVTTVKILDSNVTTAKIADANVTAAKIGAAAVTESKLHADVLLRLAETLLEDSVSVPTATASKGFVDGSGNEGLVAQLAAAGMAIRVQTGGIAYNHKGSRITLPTTTSLAVTAADATNDRKDIVVLDSGGNLAVRTGTPAGSPSDPTLTAGDVPLARIDVAANATEVVTANLTDLRERNSIDGSKLQTGSVVAAKLASNSVTTAKILDDNVTTAKILDSNVTAAKLATDSVTTAKIADGAVTAVKLASDVAGDGLASTAGVLSVNAGNGIEIASDAVKVKAANSSIQVAAGGVTAATPTTSNKLMTAATTTADGQEATATAMVSTPANGSYVQVMINGQQQKLAATTGGECYFSGDSGSTARALNAVVAGDNLYWNGSVAGYELASTDVVEFNYVV